MKDSLAIGAVLIGASALLFEISDTDPVALYPVTLPDKVISLVPRQASPEAEITRTAAPATPSPAPTSFSETSTDDHYETHNDNLAYPSLPLRQAEILMRRERYQLDSQDILDLMAKDYAWEAADSGDLTRHAGLNTGRERLPIQLDPRRLEVLVSGDRVRLPIPAEKMSVEMLVEEVFITDEGGLTFDGRLTDFEESHRVTLTSGQQLVLGGISTPFGYYVVQSMEGEGWIAQAGELSQQAPGQPDAVVPALNQKNKDVTP